MTHAKDWETLDDLRATGASSDQLRRWRQLGLVPSPRRVGLGHGKGSMVFYPAGTSRLVSRIQELLKIERDLSSVGYQLWCERYPVTGFIRDLFVEALGHLEQRMTRKRLQLERGIDDPHFAETEHAPRRMGWLWKTIGNQDYPYFERVVLDAMAGEPDYAAARDPDDAEILQKALDAAMPRLGLAKLAALLDFGPEEMLELLAKANPSSIRAAIREMPTSDLDEVREEAREVCTRWSEYAEEPLPHPMSIPPQFVVHGVLLRLVGISFSRFAQAIEDIPEMREYLGDDFRRSHFRGGFLKRSELTDKA